MQLADARRYLNDPLVPRWRKLLGLGALAYVALPFDAIPDVVPLVGWLDDVGVLAMVATLVARDVRRHVALRAAGPRIVDGDVVDAAPVR